MRAERSTARYGRTPAVPRSSPTLPNTTDALRFSPRSFAADRLNGTTVTSLG